MLNIETAGFEEMLQAMAELPEDIRQSETMQHVIKNIETGIVCYRQTRLEDALKAFNEALWHLRTVEARRLEYYVFKRVRSLYYELGRPTHELDYYYR